MAGGIGSPPGTPLTPPQDQEGSAESRVIMEGQVKFAWPGWGATTLLHTHPLFKITTGSNLQDSPSTPHSCSSEVPKATVLPLPCQAHPWPLSHLGLAAEMLRKLGTSRGCGNRWRWHGSKRVFLKGSCIPPTPTRGSTAWQGWEEPFSTGGGQAGRGLAWGPVEALCRSVKWHPKGKGRRLG